MCSDNQRFIFLMPIEIRRVVTLTAEWYLADAGDKSSGA